jgi:hypothetical protein
VPIVCCETRALAQEWAYRLLGAVRQAAEQERGGALAVDLLQPARPLAPREPTSDEVRAWAVERGMTVSDRGRVPREIVEAYRTARFAG